LRVSIFPAIKVSRDLFRDIVIHRDKYWEKFQEEFPKLANDVRLMLDEDEEEMDWIIENTGLQTTHAYLWPRMQELMLVTRLVIGKQALTILSESYYTDQLIVASGYAQSPEGGYLSLRDGVAAPYFAGVLGAAHKRSMEEGDTYRLGDVATKLQLEPWEDAKIRYVLLKRFNTVLPRLTESTQLH
jgi:hypothetical protein